MRLPFGLGRRSNSGDGALGGGSAAGSGAAGGTSAGGPVARPAAASRAWESLPPIQRTAREMPLVAAPGDFAEALPGSRALPPIVQPLGHEVSALATPGLVVARVRPVEAAASHAIPAPVQRRASRAARSSAAPGAADAPADMPAASEGADHAAPDFPAVPVLAAPPVRSLPTVSRLSIRMPDRPLTNAAVAARSAAVQRAAAASPGAGAQLPAPSGGMRRAPAGSPIQSTVSRQAAASTTAPAPQASAAVESAPGRHGIGEPVSSVPASARSLSAGKSAPVVSRSTTTGPMPTAASTLRSPVQRSTTPATEAGAHRGPSAGSPGSPAATDTALRLPELPLLPVARSTSVGTSAAALSLAAALAPPAPPATPPMAAPEIRPIAGANPIRPAIALQRSAAEQDDDATDETALPSPWWAPSPETSLSQAFAGGAEGIAVPIQRSQAGAGASPAPPFLRSDGPGQVFGRASTRSVQRTTGQPTGSPLTLRGATRNDGGPAGAAATVSAPGTAPALPAGHGRVLGVDPVVQTSSAGSTNGAGPAASPSSPGGSAVVQRAEGTVATAAPEPEPSSSPSAGGPSAGGPSERDLDELAQALFGRIRGLVRSDLIHDREAKGLTFDNV